MREMKIEMLETIQGGNCFLVGATAPVGYLVSALPFYNGSGIRFAYNVMIKYCWNS